jgi:methionine-R-sulfoxide reductase
MLFLARKSRQKSIFRVREATACLTRAMDQKKAKEKLSDAQYRVLYRKETDRPFSHPYTDEKRPGIYVDPYSGEPLFSSLDKFDSGCGWPSFSKPIDETSVFEQSDSSFGMERQEVLSDSSSGHLGHVFRGPYEGPTGVRYCINGNALRFIPLEDLEIEGYGAYLRLFKK